MLTCPHCVQQSAIPCAEEFAFIDVGRFTCEHCGREFLVMDNVPITEQQEVSKMGHPRAAAKREE
jgi:transposase-like protein